MGLTNPTLQHGVMVRLGWRALALALGILLLLICLHLQVRPVVPALVLPSVSSCLLLLLLLFTKMCTTMMKVV